MIIEMTNTSKEMFTSDFILTRKGEQIGEFHVKGRLGSIEGEVEGRIFKDRIRMKRCRKRDVKRNKPEAPKPFRPYELWLNDQPIGYVYNTCVKTGFLKEYAYHKMYFYQQEYESYGYSRGKVGVKIMQYFQETQLAEIELPATIYNDLYHYRLYIRDEADVTVTLITTIYRYILGCFNPGTKVVSSVVTSNYYTKAQELIEKYDPDFIKTIEE